MAGHVPKRNRGLLLERCRKRWRQLAARGKTLSQVEAASGLGHATVRRYLVDDPIEHEPSPGTLEKLAAALDVLPEPSPDWAVREPEALYGDAALAALVRAARESGHAQELAELARRLAEMPERQRVGALKMFGLWM